MPLSATKTDCSPILEDSFKIHGVPHQEQVRLASEVLEQSKRVPLRWLNDLPLPPSLVVASRVPLRWGMEMDSGSKGYSVLTRRKPIV